METITLIYKWPPTGYQSHQQLLYVDEEVIVTGQRVKPKW